MNRWRIAGKWVAVIFFGIIVLLSGIYLVARVEKRDLDQAARSEAGGEFVELDQGIVHYYLEGPVDAPVVLLIHGFSVPSYVWEPTTSFLNGQGYRTLRFDLYGRGFSDRPDLVYDLPFFCDQVSGLVTELGLDQPIIVVGLSMGGPVAARFAQQNPDLAAGVILISPLVTPPTNGDVLPLNIPLVGEYVMAAIMEPFVLPGLQLEDFIRPENFPQWTEMYREQLQFKGTGRALLSTIRQLVKMDSEAEYQLLNESGIPVLLLWGNADQSVDAVQIETLQQILPGMDARIFPGAGHLLHYEIPDKVNPIIAEFLDFIIN